MGSIINSPYYILTLVLGIFGLLHSHSVLGKEIINQANPNETISFTEAINSTTPTQELLVTSVNEHGEISTDTLNFEIAFLYNLEIPSAIYGANGGYWNSSAYVLSREFFKELYGEDDDTPWVLEPVLLLLVGVMDTVMVTPGKMIGNGISGPRNSDDIKEITQINESLLELQENESITLSASEYNLLITALYNIH